MTSNNGTSLQRGPPSVLRPPSEIVNQLQHESHVIAGLDEKRVFRIWDPVLGFSQKKVHKEEEGRSEDAAGCGQRVSAVQVRYTQCGKV